MLITLLFLLLAPVSVHAATLQVANNGLDGAACGTKTDPCRTITRAIDNAADGDIIVVGPGRYGDLDRDGTLGEANEEGPETFAMILIDKAVAIESSGGAAVTVIDAANGNRAAVRITASGARFGKAKKGFTLFAAGVAGVSVEAPAAGVVVEGNLALGTNTGFNASGPGAGNVLQGNVAVFSNGGFALGGNGPVARANLAVANNQNGFDLGAGGPRCEGNVATANVGFGYQAGLYDEATLIGNVAVGNLQGVFGGNGDSLTITGLAAIANLQGGVHNQNTTTMTLSASNLIGNGTKPFVFVPNCGTINEDNTLIASNVFWGAATGPGGDPADDVCDVDDQVTTIAPIAAKPFKVKTKVPAL